MKRQILIILSLILFGITSAEAQYLWDVGLKAGGSNYLGDIGGMEKTRRDFIMDMKLSQTRWATGLFGRYKLTDDISLSANLYYGRIQGADSLSTNPGRTGRNLSFRNDMFELNVRGEYNFYEVNDVGGTGRYRNDFRLYAFLGVGGLYHNPQAYYNGRWVDLRPLKTEGVDYSPFVLVLPKGLGCYFTFDRQYRVGFELGWRTTFTDYLDDISGNYPDPSELDSELARALSNRRGELPAEGYPDPANYGPPSETNEGKRGDPTNNDSYLFATFTFSYVIRGRSNFYRQFRGSWFKSGRTKRSGRKRRVKF